ncbi:hypothetical protein DFH09DRAFT_1369723 [Mycena vulgaris]|nr:hypothetical protein DFH09DRAFT_1369723 [Mycena vulgaris]
MLLKPISRGLKTLESSQVTCSDVFNIWIGIAVGFKEVFCNPTAAINEYNQEMFDCYNRRFAIFMNDCTPGMFILSYLLDPGAISTLCSSFLTQNINIIFYYRDGALRLGLPPRQDFNKETASPLVGYLITSARLMLRAEQKREQRGDSSEGDILVKQIISFMYREAPFDLPCTDLTLRLAWWKSLAKDSNAYVLAKVRLELPTPNRKPSDPIVSGIPTLRDLLNADTVDQHPIDEEALFNHPDPYGIKDFEAMEEGEDETDTAPPPLVIRRANIPSLEIETYIDLNTPKLALRFAPDQGKPQPPVPAAAEKPVRAPNAKWSMEDTEWDATAR